MSSLVAALLPSVSGRRSSYHLVSSSPRFPPQASSHPVVCHMGSRHFFIREYHIIMHLLDSWNEFSSSVSSSKSSNTACCPLWSRKRLLEVAHSPSTEQWGSPHSCNWCGPGSSFSRPWKPLLLCMLCIEGGYC